MAFTMSPAEPTTSQPAAEIIVPNDTNSSGVSWGAVIGGAFAASALYLILLALGAGMGLSAISPWAGAGLSAAAVGTVALIWLIVAEVLASALGGYLTGRMRTKWVLVHTHEVFFRDTANGFLAWAVALVMTVAFLASAATAMVGGLAQREPVAEPNAYFVDALFRADRSNNPPPDAPLAAAAGRIFANALHSTSTSQADQDYLAALVAQRTGMTLPDAQKRVSDVLINARSAEDEARKLTARFLLWFFMSLLIGAFAASYAATIGGRQRDHVKAV